MSRDGSSSDDEPTIERRNLLRALAAGSTIPLASEPALGRPPWAGGSPDDGNGNGPPENSPQEYEGCSCGAGEWLAKYEERGGELEFEEGTDVGDVEVTETKEGDEITGFNFYTDRADIELCVKHGPELTAFDDSDRTDNGSGFAYCYEVEIDDYAVSNFVVCPVGDCTYYQIDFVTGEPIVTDCCTIESYGPRVLASAFGNTCDGGITRRVTGDLGTDYDDCFEIPFAGSGSGDDNPHRIAEITLENGEAGASFEPVECQDPPEQVSLVIYEVTDPPYSTDNQDLLDATEEEWDDLDLEDVNHLRVDLPEDGSS